MRAVIIAGGSGTRLRPLTYNTPKPIIPLFEKAFLIYQIEHLKKYGITEIIINTHYLHTRMKEIIKDGSDFGVKVFYSHEDSPMGTAGAVKAAEEFFNDEPLLILNGDILTDVPLDKIIETHKSSAADVTLTLTRVKDPTAYGLIFTDENSRVTRFLEKPSYDEAVINTINAGIYIINPDIFSMVPKDKPYSFERGLFPYLLNNNYKMMSYTSDSYWIDIGTPEKFLQVHHDVLLEKIKNINLPGKKESNNIWKGENCQIDPSVVIQGPAFIGNNVKISKGCFIEEFSVIGNNVQIGEKSQIYKSLIFSDTKINEGCTVKECIIGKSCIIEENSKVTTFSVLADESNLKKGTII